MKKLTSLLISCSLTLTGAAIAQQPEPTPKPKSSEKGKGHADEAKPKANEAKPAAVAPEAKKPVHTSKGDKSEVVKGTETPTTDKSVETSPKHHTATKAEKAPADVPTTSATAAPTPGKKQAKGNTEMKAADGAKTSPAATAAAKKPDPQKVKQIKAQHANFHAQPKPDQVPAVTFNQSYRIEGSDQWQGRQYEAFRSYHPERHDEHWYRSHYDHVELVGGGYYYLRDGYWYPAWGYNPTSEYYAYDGPIYVGRRAEPPDRVIADVQAVLQNMEYYKGEVDGLLGPLTREALTGYQSDHGLAPTAAIDEPTLDALGME